MEETRGPERQAWFHLAEAGVDLVEAKRGEGEAAADREDVHDLSIHTLPAKK